jgi:hypothetical protein
MTDQLGALRQKLTKYRELDTLALLITREGHYNILQNQIFQIAELFRHNDSYKNNLKIIVNELIDDAWELKSRR